MNDITKLIAAITPRIPFSNPADAQAFLSQYNVSDQAALVSAMYIGRDHIHDQAIQQNYVPAGMDFDRAFHTGNGTTVRWLINPNAFADILYEKNTNLTTYYAAFVRCASASGHNLAIF